MHAAKAAVIRRLNHFLPSLPSWSSCASEFGWDSATLGHNDRWYDECPDGGTPDAPGIDASTCSGTNADSCAFSYSAQKKVRVQVAVDGTTAFAPNHTLTHVVRPPGSKSITCPEIPIIGVAVPLPGCVWPALARRPVVLRPRRRAGRLQLRSPHADETDTDTASRPPRGNGAAPSPEMFRPVGVLVSA